VSKLNLALRLEEWRGAIDVLPIDEQHDTPKELHPVEVITIDNTEDFILKAE
jgi:hypothetical protein